MPHDRLNARSLIECVPNISLGVPGRDLERITAAVTAPEGVGLLNRHTDADHNRTVLTLAGTERSLAIAVEQLIEAALGSIDLNHHWGQHPRVGAVDVVPFIPITGVTRETCVALSRNTGYSVADKFSIPVFLYGYAAASEARRTLSRVRNVGFERLRDLIRSDDRYHPDFGPAELHPTAGAVMMGVRDLLVAFNVNLGGSDVALAKRIASEIRTSGGGMPGVQALGVAVKDHAQVTTNLFDLKSTSPIDVFRQIRELARAGGSDVAGAEFVGLVPRQAVSAGELAELPLIHPMTDRILEERVAAYFEELDG